MTAPSGAPSRAEATSSRSRRFHAASLLVALAAVWAIVSTYGVLSHTADEPLHVAAGLEWLREGTHVLKPENPPLAEIAAGLGAYLTGRRFPPSGAPFRRGTEILYAEGEYSRNLVLARLGLLPFFLLAVFMVWSWSLREGGPRAAFLATASFCTLPPVLGHAGMAATDMAAAATLLVALRAMQRWLDSPSVARSVQLGLGLALAFVTKFSALVFLPAGFVVLVLARTLRRRSDVPSVGASRVAGATALALAIGAVGVWACYRFSVGSLAETPGAPRLIRTCFPDEDGLARRLVEWAAHAWRVAPEAPLGLLALQAHVRQGHSAYLLGQVSDVGFWYFYPVVLALRTPLTFAVFAAIGVLGAAARAASRSREALAPAAVAGALLLAVMPSTINIGVRHVLVVYPLLAIAAGLGVDRLLRSSSGRLRGTLRALTAVLLCGQGLLILRVHPDHLAYFNSLAGGEPGRVALDSDLDWGQDVLQLAEALEGRDVDVLHIATFGSARLCEHGLPPLRWLEPGRPVTGWVAISEMYFRGHWRMSYADPCDRDRPVLSEARDGYAWLGRYEPVARAGSSIRIYHVPEAPDG